MKRFIYLVGKSDPHLESVQAIRRLGYKVGIFLDDTSVLTRPEKFDRVIPINYTDIDTAISKLDSIELEIAGLVCTFENYIIAKSKLAKHFNVPSSTTEASEMATDKYLMRQAFMNEDPSITPRFAQIDSVDTLLAFAQTTTYPLIIKPTNLVKSLLVMRCNNEDELLANFSYAQENIRLLYEKYHIYDRKPQLIVEEFITGKSCSVAAFIDDRGTPHFCDGIVNLTTAYESGVDDTYLYSRELPFTLPESIEDRIFEVAKKGVHALDMRSTPAHIELMYDGEQVKLIEIGARIGGYRPRMYQFSYGINLVDQEVKVATGQPPDMRGKFAAYSAVFELFPETEGAFSSIDVGDVDIHKLTYYKVRPKVGRTIGPAKNGYKAAAIVIVVSKKKNIFDTLCSQVKTMKVTVI